MLKPDIYIFELFWSKSLPGKFPKALFCDLSHQNIFDKFSFDTMNIRMVERKKAKSIYKVCVQRMRVLSSSKVFEQNQLRRSAILGTAYTMKSLGLGVLVYRFKSHLI